MGFSFDNPDLLPISPYDSVDHPQLPRSDSGEEVGQAQPSAEDIESSDDENEHLRPIGNLKWTGNVKELDMINISSVIRTTLGSGRGQNEEQEGISAASRLASSKFLR